MAFAVTEDFRVYDPDNAFRKLDPMQKVDLLWDARDVWEKNFGPWEGKVSLPGVVVGKAPQKKVYDDFGVF